MLKIGIGDDVCTKGGGNWRDGSRVVTWLDTSLDIYLTVGFSFQKSPGTWLASG